MNRATKKRLNEISINIFLYFRRVDFLPMRRERRGAQDLIKPVMPATAKEPTLGHHQFSIVFTLCRLIYAVLLYRPCCYLGHSLSIARWVTGPAGLGCRPLRPLPARLMHDADALLRPDLLLLYTCANYLILILEELISYFYGILDRIPLYL